MGWVRRIDGSHRISAWLAVSTVFACMGCSAAGTPAAFVEDPSALAAEAGFIEIEPHAYCYSTTDSPADAVDYQASSARLFYAFTPADQGPTDAPLFVLYNGGPGSATMGNLRAFGTAPYTLIDGDAKNALVPNPVSWSSLGNLLYIDARQTGFSYSTLPNPSDADARGAEFADRNFNLYLDAADVLRVLLRFLASRPLLRDNRIVFVGESYAGIRTSLILNYLLDPKQLLTCGSWFFTDPLLVEEIREHHRAVFPNEDQTRIEGASAARQFSHQILIQPIIAPYHQFRFEDWCGPEYGLGVRAAELSVPCPAQQGQNDIYNITKPPGWLDALGEQARLALSSSEFFPKLVGVDPRSIRGLSSAEREGAYRGPNLDSAPNDLTSLSTTLGSLPSYDHYYLGRAQFQETDNYGGQDIQSIKLGRFFLRSLIHVQTLVTRALLDTVVNADRFPIALAQYASDPDPAPISDVVADVAPRDGVARPGWISVTYTGKQFDAVAGTTRVIRFPTYRDAGHVVSASSPEELYSDVRDFIRETAR